METTRRSASFSFDRATTRAGRRERWRPIDLNLREVGLLHRRDEVGHPAVSASSSQTELAGEGVA